MSENTIQIGQILIQQGVLSEQQVFEISQAQKKNPNVPFGVLAERLFDVTSQTIEQAWIEQYHHFTGTTDLRDQEIDERVLSVINRRQAWQFEVLPLRYEPTGELLVAASKHRLARAVSFMTNQMESTCLFRVANRTQLRDFLSRHYPMSEVTEEILCRAREMAHA
ncbi:MAG TPA: hypothetical protein DCM28_00050 [Phycisphaerales bacterium]|nr:hypothetical protein [Phycisphaerales bacterium]HCD31302.1 hypothetical protein [Phycisphaerales bacterium]